MRTKPTELPDYRELCDILTYEASRPIPKEKERVHYGDFTTILNLLKTYNLPTRFFDEEIHFKDLKETGFFGEICSMFNDLMNNVLRTQDDPKKQALFNNLYDYLSESDEPEQADIIFEIGRASCRERV